MSVESICTKKAVDTKMRQSGGALELGFKRTWALHQKSVSEVYTVIGIIMFIQKTCKNDVASPGPEKSVSQDLRFIRMNRILCLPARRMLAAASYFNNSAVFCVLAILAAVFAILFGLAVTRSMRALVFVCHLITLP
jgi:hypothetical protein